MAAKKQPPNDLFGLVGQRIDGKYDIVSVVAEGGFGVVYRGVHGTLGTPVAFKVLKSPPDLEARAREAFFAGFMLEAQMTARLDHPAIARALDFGSSPMPGGEVAAWMVLEWVEGRTLADVQEARRGQGGRSPAEVLALLLPVLEALAYAHAQGIAHRDLKPANIMLVGGASSGALYARPAVRLLDFGIAKVMDPGEQSGSGQTQTRAALQSFSPLYAAPEQVSGTRTGPWTDVHALGLILTELLTDRPPYVRGEPVAIFAQVLASQRPTPAHFGIDAGPWEPVLARALALLPHDRFQNAGELVAALTAALPRTLPGAAEAAFVPPSAPPAVSVASAPVLQPVATTNRLASRPGRVVVLSVVLGVSIAASLGVALLPFATKGDASRRDVAAPSRTPTAPTSPGQVALRAKPPPADIPPNSRPAVVRDVAAGPLALGLLTSCVVMADATVRCWGQKPLHGGNSLVPVAIQGLEDVARLALGTRWSYCVQQRGGTVRCWGSNEHGQLGDGTFAEHADPSLVTGLDAVTDLALGESATCAVIADGTVRCWGDDEYGQLGFVASTTRCQGQRTYCEPRPVLVPGVSSVAEIVFGEYQVYALRRDGTVWRWGRPGSGPVTPPAPLRGLAGVAQLTVSGNDVMYARLRDGTIRRWNQHASPTAVVGLEHAVQVVSGSSFACARLAEGTVLCWGDNESGQLGDGTTRDSALPTAVRGLVDAVELAAGGHHACARIRDGTVRCWGDNDVGQLGDGTTTSRSLPTTVRW